MSDHQPISGRALLERMRDHGIVNDGDGVRRVVIDAQIGKAAIIYVERIGDERLLSVVPALTDVEIGSVVTSGDDA